MSDAGTGGEMVGRRAYLSRLDDLLPRLQAAYDEYATCWEAERMERSSAIQQVQSSGLGQGAADNWVSAKIAPLSCETVRISYDIRAMEAERDYLYFRIEHL